HSDFDLLGKRKPARDLAQGLPGHILHDYEAVAVSLALDFVNLVNRSYVGMIEGRGCLRFAEETRAGIVAPQSVRKHELERDVPVEARIFGLKDLAHPSGAQSFQYSIMGDSFTDHNDTLCETREQFRMFHSALM